DDWHASAGEHATDQAAAHAELEGRSDALLGHTADLLDDRDVGLERFDDAPPFSGVDLAINDRDVVDDFERSHVLEGENEGISPTDRARVDAEHAHQTISSSIKNRVFVESRAGINRPRRPLAFLQRRNISIAPGTLLTSIASPCFRVSKR